MRFSHFFCLSYLFLFLLLSTILLYECISLFIHNPVDRCLDCFQFLAIINKVSMSSYERPFWDLVSFFSYKYLGVWLLDNRVKGRMINVLRNCQTSFPSGSTILHSHQQCPRVLVIPHSLQHLFFFILPILMDVEWYFIIFNILF